MKLLKDAILLLIIAFFVTSCSNTNINIKDLLQSTNAMILKRDFEDISSLLIELKLKLDLRNPKNYDKNNHAKIVENIKKKGNNFNFSVTDKNVLDEYHKYLNLAFDTQNIKWYRNDLLIVGIYKMLYDAYELQDGHKITALSYSAKKMQIAFKYLQVIRWRINTLKLDNGEPIFVTWQNNWQLELMKKKSGKDLNLQDMATLKSLDIYKESLLDSSNMSFDNIFAQMIYIMKRDLKLIGLEPSSLGIEGIKSVILFL